MQALLGPAFSALESSLHFRLARESVLAGNVANADTPGYRRRDLNFESIMNDELGRLVRTHPRHLPTSTAGAESYRPELGPRGTRPDGNGVDLDREVLEAHRNAGIFSDHATILARVSALLRAAMGSSS